MRCSTVNVFALLWRGLLTIFVYYHIAPQNFIFCQFCVIQSLTMKVQFRHKSGKMFNTCC